LELDADEPFVEDRCGTCTRCLEACPTSAIVAPHELDARLCISYLTIELRGAIPRELRSAQGALVFGCDICQDVCPWNVKFAHTAQEPALTPRPENVEPDLAELVTLNDDDFRARFRKSAVKRSKRAGLARNAAVALGNRRDPRDVPALTHALTRDTDPIVRVHAAWALGRFTANDSARGALLAAAASETDANVCAEINAALNDVSA
jgi:epoxyqueuosine reductase